MATFLAISVPLPGESKTIGRIVLDASFSPVFVVSSYSVESARVEQRTDLDRLVLDIETNGAVDPKRPSVLLRVLMDQLRFC